MEEEEARLITTRGNLSVASISLFYSHAPTPAAAICAGGAEKQNGQMSDDIQSLVFIQIFRVDDEVLH